jgi:hypothetical protein
MKNTKARQRGTHNGERTQTHDHEIILHSFRTIKASNRRLVKPIPPLVDEFLSDIIQFE